jgi:hypothetical protein
MDRLSKLRILGSAGLFALASAWGCASPHWVMRDGNGGIVAIPENSNHWPTYYRQQADEMIKQVCPKGYAIDREEEVVVGQTVTTQRDTDNHAYDLAPKKSPDQLKLVTHTTTETTSTRNVKEYQIAFHGSGDNH